MMFDYCKLISLLLTMQKHRRASKSNTFLLKRFLYIQNSLITFYTVQNSDNNVFIFQEVAVKIYKKVQSSAFACTRATTSS